MQSRLLCFRITVWMVILRINKQKNTRTFPIKAFHIEGWSTRDQLRWFPTESQKTVSHPLMVWWGQADNFEYFFPWLWTTAGMSSEDYGGAGNNVLSKRDYNRQWRLGLKWNKLQGVTQPIDSQIWQGKMSWSLFCFVLFCFALFGGGGAL